MPKPLPHSTIHDLLRGKNATAPDAWTVSMFVLACAWWGSTHGSPILPELTTADVQGLLRLWQQRRTDYEALLRLPSPEQSRAEVVRVGVVPMLADRFQRRTVGLDVARTDARATTLLVGSGGVGKTQLAVEFADRVWLDPRIRLAIWTTADSRLAIATAYAEAAARILGVDPSEPDLAARQLLAWLATTDERWVVILDDLQRPEDLHGLWPRTGRRGQVVVTTRRRDPSLCRVDRVMVQVDVFSPDESLAYLTAKLADYPEFMQGAAELADVLGHLPLALAQAVAYQLNRNLSCARYLDRFLDRGKALADVVPAHDELPDDHQRTIGTTWSLSVDLADSLTPSRLARPILELVSLLDPAGVPAAVFTVDSVLAYLAQSAGSPSDGAVIDADTVQDALGNLHRLSLITLDTLHADRAVRVHALVQRATYDTMSIPARREAAVAVANALLAVWPEIELSSLLEQALRANTEALNNTAGDHLWESNAPGVLFRAGHSLGDSGLCGRAMEWFQRLRNTAAAWLSADHRTTLSARNGCAYWRVGAGDLVGAVAEFEQVLADQIRVLGPDDPDTMITRGNLALLRGEAGDPLTAVAEFEQVLADQIRVLGPDDPDTMITRSSLAALRGEAGEPLRAVAELTAVLADQQRVFGINGHATVATRGRLARWRSEAGDTRGAVSEREAVLDVRQRELGPTHPETLSARDSLARARGMAGDTPGAVAELEAIVTDHLIALGADHPYTLTARHNLACWRGKAGEPHTAVVELTSILADDIRVLGADHPDTLLTRNNLASWLGEAGNPAAAVTELESLVNDRARVFGPQHPDTLITRSNLVLWRSRLPDD